MTILCVGLGNPGNEYASTRHNIGFMALDCIIQRYNFMKSQHKYGGDMATGTIDGYKVLALKPQTYMNTSGVCVSQVAHFYKIPSQNIIVFYDELDLPLGKIRVKIGGGNGGHNGLRSLDAHMPKEYVRVRMGIGHPGDKSRVTGYVLGRFCVHERPVVDTIVEHMATHLPLLLDDNAGEFMNKLALCHQANKGDTNGL